MPGLRAWKVHVVVARVPAFPGHVLPAAQIDFPGPHFSRPDREFFDDRAILEAAGDGQAPPAGRKPNRERLRDEVGGRLRPERVARFCAVDGGSRLVVAPVPDRQPDRADVSRLPLLGIHEVRHPRVGRRDTPVRRRPPRVVAERGDADHGRRHTPAGRVADVHVERAFAGLARQSGESQSQQGQSHRACDEGSLRLPSVHVLRFSRAVAASAIAAKLNTRSGFKPYWSG